MKKQIVSIILLIALMAITGIVSADNKCGVNLTWELSENGVMTISGTGPMSSYNWSSDVPWKDVKENILTINVEEGVTSIGKNAFYWCKNLTAVTLPESLTTIEDYAFQSNGKLASINIPESVTVIGKNAFEGCSALTGINIPSGIQIIENSTFNSCSGLVSITLPEKLTYIGDSAFKGCSAISSIEIPASVTYISPSGAFNNCKKLEAITVSPDNPNYASEDGVLFDKAFTTLLYYPSGKTDAAYNVASGITKINDYAFSRNSNLINLTIPDTVKTIGEYAFYDDSKLLSVTLPEGLETIGKNAFESCSNLKSITLPASLISLGERAFLYCKALNEITVSDGSQNYISVGGVLFNADQSELIAYPTASNKNIYQVPESTEIIGAYAFYNNDNLITITFPESLLTISESAFRDCDKLTNLEFPPNLISIDDYAFNDCDSLTTLVFPESLNLLGDGAFDWCKNLISVTVMNPAVSFDKWGVFDYGNENLILYGFPGSTTEAYALDAEHSFAEIVPETPEVPAETPADGNPAETAADTDHDHDHEAETWICAACGNEMTGGKFCSECGAPKPQPQVCGNCGFEVPEGMTMKFCPICGTKFEEKPVLDFDLSALTDEEKAVFLILLQKVLTK